MKLRTHTGQQIWGRALVRTRRRLVAALAFAAFLTLGSPFAWSHDTAHPHPMDEPQVPREVVLDRYPGMGGEFVLQNARGEPFRLSSRRGRIVLLFFGYTHCADACPLAMATAAKALALLGADAALVDVVFITTDPARDTPARLSNWLGQFNSRFIGLTGPADAVAAVEKKYAAFHQALAESDARSYQVMHTSRLFLIDGQGSIRYLFTPDQPPDAVARGIRLALEERTMLGRFKSWWADLQLGWQRNRGW